MSGSRESRASGAPACREYLRLTVASRTKPHRGPEGRPLNVSPARKGWVGISLPPSAVGAAPMSSKQTAHKTLRRLCNVEVRLSVYNNDRDRLPIREYA